MIHGKLTYKISTKLRHTLEANCSAVEMFKTRINAFLKPGYRHLVDGFDVVAAPYIEVLNWDDNHARPVFIIKELEVSPKNLPNHKDKKKVEEWSIISTVASNIHDRMEDERHLPIKLECLEKISILKDFEDAEKYYCLTSEARELRQKYMETFRKAEEYG